MGNAKDWIPQRSVCKVGVDFFFFFSFLCPCPFYVHVSCERHWDLNLSTSTQVSAGISPSHLQETEEKIKKWRWKTPPESTWYIFSFCSSLSRLPPPWTATFEWFACWCPCCWPVAAWLWSVDCWELRMACTPCPSWLQRWELSLRTRDQRRRTWNASGNGCISSVCKCSASIQKKHPVQF